MKVSNKLVSLLNHGGFFTITDYQPDGKEPTLGIKIPNSLRMINALQDLVVDIKELEELPQEDLDYLDALIEFKFKDSAFILVNFEENCEDYIIIYP